MELLPIHKSRTIVMIKKFALLTLPLFQSNYRDNCPGGRHYEFHRSVNSKVIADQEMEKSFQLLMRASKRAGTELSGKPLTEQQTIAV